VVLLEISCFPRHKPGETLHPGVEPILRTLGVVERLTAQGFLRHAGHWITWGGPARFEPFGNDADGPWRGFQALRAQFDTLLLESARDAGAWVILPCRATRVINVDGRVTGVVTCQGRMHARFVVDASGSGQWLARQLRQQPQRWSPQLIVRYGYVKGDCPAREDAPLLVADAAGWTWMARVAPQLYAWTRLDISPRETAVRSWRPDEFRSLTPVSNGRGADVTWKITPQPAGPGYFAVGDSAAVLDPASSHGVLKALMSGILAARRIVQVIREGVPEPAAADDYNRWVRGQFTHDVERLDTLYRIFPAWRGTGTAGTSAG